MGWPEKLTFQVQYAILTLYLFLSLLFKLELLFPFFLFFFAQPVTRVTDLQPAGLQSEALMYNVKEKYNVFNRLFIALLNSCFTEFPIVNVYSNKD